MTKPTYTSTALNLVLNVNESVKITTINRNGLETFVGISYLEMNPNL